MDLPASVANKIKKIFTEETLEKINTARSAVSACGESHKEADSLRDIYIIFHTLKGTGKSVGFERITEIASQALDATVKAMDGEMSLKLFKAKTEVSLIEIEEEFLRQPVRAGSDSFEKTESGTDMGTVLVVDDDISLLRAISERLSIEGFQVLTATSLEEVEVYLERRTAFDLIIIDVIMPGGSGFELCRRIRKEQNYDDTPIIFLTAEESDELKLKGFEIGADDYLVKPISLNEIAVKVKATVVRTRRYRDRIINDDLTGAYNRSFLKNRFDEEKSRSHRYGKSFGFCLLDLDSFKNVNDTYGHLAGDRVLIDLVNFSKGHIRPSDTVIRFGGDEFILFLSQINKNEIVDIMNRLRGHFAQQVFNPDGKAFSVTFSAGVAIYPEDGINLEELLNVADRALYEAKQAGGNRVNFQGGDAR